MPTSFCFKLLCTILCIIALISISSNILECLSYFKSNFVLHNYFVHCVPCVRAPVTSLPLGGKKNTEWQHSVVSRMFGNSWRGAKFPAGEWGRGSKCEAWQRAVPPLNDIVHYRVRNVVKLQSLLNPVGFSHWGTTRWIPTQQMIVEVYHTASLLDPECRCRNQHSTFGDQKGV